MKNWVEEVISDHKETDQPGTFYYSDKDGNLRIGTLEECVLCLVERDGK